jgi:hypothetical protein
MQTVVALQMEPHQPNKPQGLHLHGWLLWTQLLLQVVAVVVAFAVDQALLCGQAAA